MGTQGTMGYCHTLAWGLEKPSYPLFRTMPLDQRASHMERMTSIKNMEHRDRYVEKGNIKKHLF
jgi:hypothetical protein